MVDGIDGNENVIKLKSQNRSIDTSRLEGLKKTKKNELIFNKFDSNSDGTLDKTEADNMQSWLKQAAGNKKLSRKEMENATGGNESAFEALVNLTQQQADLADRGEYVENNGKVTTHVVKKEDQITKFDSTEDENENVVETYEDGSKKIIHEDDSYDEVSADGTTVTSFDKDGNKTKVVKGDLTTTFEEGKSKTVNKDNKVVEETETKDGKEVKTTYEYKENQTIKRQFTDNTLNFITVEEQKEGKTVETTYEKEEDMTSEKPKPSKVVEKDSEGKTTTTEYEYLENGTVKTKVTDPEGKETVTYQDKDGKPVEKPETNTPEAKDTYTVSEGQGIYAIVRDILKQQGIENPTKEQLKQAREQFLELNKDLVKTYHGSKTEWHGNKYFYIGDKVKVPDFSKLQETTETPEKPEETTTPSLTDEQKKKIDELHTETRQQEIEKLKEILGENYLVEEKDGKLVVKDKQGNVLEEITDIVNDKNTDADDIAKMLKSDKDDNKTLEFAEFQTFIEELLKEYAPSFEITDANRAKVEEIIRKHFDNIDSSVKKDGSLTKEELEAKAKEAIPQLTEELNKIE